jgi:hypothetical protein
MRNKGFLVVLLSTCMVSPFAMAGDDKSAIELNTTQMDNITAGAAAGAGAAAAAAASGIIANSIANTITVTGLTSESGGVAAAGAGAIAVGTDTAATGASATTDADGPLPSYTFGGGIGINNSLISFSGAVEITVIPTLPTIIPEGI